MSSPVPVTVDHDTGGYWLAAARKAIAVLHCRSCAAPIHLPMPYCPDCGSNDLAWKNVAPTGRVYSYTVVEQSVHPAFAAPYTVTLIELDEVPGVRLIGYLPGRPPIQIGMTMKATFAEVGGITLPNWEQS